MAHMGETQEDVVAPLLEVVAVELKLANEFVARLHRHHGPERGHRFSIGVVRLDTRQLCGVAIVGRPKARMINQRRIVEVTRLATDGTRNACSLLYGAAARAAKAIGYEEIITYTLEEEPGTSLRAVGWEEVALVRAEQWSRPSRARRAGLLARKRKWRRLLRAVELGEWCVREPEPWLAEILERIRAARARPGVTHRDVGRIPARSIANSLAMSGVRCTLPWPCTSGHSSENSAAAAG